MTWFKRSPQAEVAGSKLVTRHEVGILVTGLVATVAMSPYRDAAGPPLLNMWLYGHAPPVGAPLYFLKSAGNGDGKNGIVRLYESWRRYMSKGLDVGEIRSRLTVEAHQIFHRQLPMLEINERVYAEDDRMLALMGLISDHVGVGNIPYVRVGTYQGRGGQSRTEGVRYALVRPDDW